MFLFWNKNGFDLKFTITMSENDSGYDDYDAAIAANDGDDDDNNDYTAVFTFTFIVDQCDLDLRLRYRTDGLTDGGAFLE